MRTGTWRTKREETAGALEGTGNAYGTTDGLQLVAGMMAKGWGDGLELARSGLVDGLAVTSGVGLGLATLGCSLAGEGLPDGPPAEHAASSADSRNASATKAPVRGRSGSPGRLTGL
jgi:hypothetical protein